MKKVLNQINTWSKSDQGQETIGAVLGISIAVVLGFGMAGAYAN